MKKLYFIVIIIAAMVVATSSCARRANAQETAVENVAQSEPKDTSNIDKGTPTEYTDTIAGKVYTIYLSKKGKAFIWKTKKATGEKYKQYRPEKGKRINPEAYK